MAEILVRNLSPADVRRLKQRARREGRSLQSQAKLILEQAARESALKADELIAELRAFRAKLGDRVFSDSTRLIRQDRKR